MLFAPWEFIRHRAHMPVFRRQLVFSLIAITQLTCGENRISGTYLAHSDDFAEMLQLTQTDNGRLDGVLTSVVMSREGTISSTDCKLAGAIDAGQITLLCHYGVFQDINLAGTVNAITSSIQFQRADTSGKLESVPFARSSANDFKKYTDGLKVKADGIVLTKEFVKRAQALREIVQRAENWIASADSHAQKIAGVKNYFRKLDGEMNSLVEREKTISNGVARGQIAVAVSQGNVDGSQADIQINQVWDQEIGDIGQTLANALVTFHSPCGPMDEYFKRGVTPEAIQNWQSACQQLLVEREKFAPIFRRIMEQRADLKDFQNIARSRREALVQEADRIH